MKRLIALACAIGLTAPALAQVDGSGTIVAGGTAQQVFASASGYSLRMYLFCENPVAATETLFVNAPGVAGAANGSYELAPGGTLTFANGFIPQGAVSVYAATTGHRFICKVG